MNQNNTLELFKCLCLDLGWPLRDKEPRLEELGELRKEFLLLSELRWPSKRCNVWTSKFNSVFQSNLSPWEIERPAVFRDIYQILSFMLKIPKPHTQQQESDYIEKFKTTEKSCRAYRVNRADPVTRLSRHLIRTATAIDYINPDKIGELARHGPGAVFCKSQGADKNILSSCPADLLRYIGHDAFVLNVACLMDPRIQLSGEPRERHVVSRLSLVPKDWKGPRGVFISPKEAVFCQLGIEGCLRNVINNSWFTECLDVTKQEPSRAIAEDASRSREWFTMDLSDASDRIPLSLVAHLFHRRDYLALACSRPSYVQLPSGELHRLAMFAPMGDGKTFPILSMVCSTVALAAILVQEGYSAARPPSDMVVREFARCLRVFGDDIAGKSKYFACVRDALESHNLKVNVGKSFSSGFFRESCGMDAYQGIDVTPLRLRLDLDNPTLDLLVKGIPLYNRCITRYTRLVRTAAFLRSIIESNVPDIGLTLNCEESPWCLQSHGDEVLEWARKRSRYNVDLQRLEVKVPVVRRVIQFPSSINPWWDMMYAIRSAGRSQEAVYASDRAVIVGSPAALKLQNQALTAMGMKPQPSPSDRLVRMWLPVFNR